MREVYVPSVTAWVMGNFKVAVGFAFTGAVVGEFVASSRGLGYLLQFAQSTYNAALTIALILIIMTFVLRNGRLTASSNGLKRSELNNKVKLVRELIQAADVGSDEEYAAAINDVYEAGHARNRISMSRVKLNSGAVGQGVTAVNSRPIPLSRANPCRSRV